MLRIWVTLLVGATTFSTNAYAEKFKCGSIRGQTPYEVLRPEGINHGRFAPDLSDEVKSFGAYEASFDGVDDDDDDGHPDLRAVPEWVAYELVGVKEVDGRFSEPDISIERPRDWYKSPELSFLWTGRSGIRRTRIDYSYDGIGTIWNRGHLAMADHAQRISWEASCNTHTYWNGLPQAAEMNQGPWLHLENYVAAASNKFERIWTVTGPIFDKDKEIYSIGDDGEVPVAVPHALFKILVIERPGDNEQGYEVRALIFEQPHQLNDNGVPVPDLEAKLSWVRCNHAQNRNHTYDHRQRLVSVSDIESRTGLSFFDDYPELAKQKSEVESALWPVESHFWTGFVCGGQDSVQGTDGLGP